MKIEFDKKFKRQFKKLDKKVQKKFNERVELWLEEPNHPLLNIHALKGQYYPMSSLNVTGNYRAVFFTTKNITVFYEIGTHSELYS